MHFLEVIADSSPLKTVSFPHSVADEFSESNREQETALRTSPELCKLWWASGTLGDFKNKPLGGLMQSARALESPVPVSSRVTSKLTSRWGGESDGQDCTRKTTVQPPTDSLNLFCPSGIRLPLKMWYPHTLWVLTQCPPWVNVRFTNTGKHYNGVQDVKYEVKIIQKVYSQTFPQK